MNNVDFSRYSTGYLHELVELIQAELKSRDNRAGESVRCYVCTSVVRIGDAFYLGDRDGSYACNDCFQRSEFIRQKFHQSFFYDVIGDGSAEYLEDSDLEDDQFRDKDGKVWRSYTA